MVQKMYLFVDVMCLTSVADWLTDWLKKRRKDRIRRKEESRQEDRTTSTYVYVYGSKKEMGSLDPRVCTIAIVFR